MKKRIKEELCLLFACHYKKYGKGKIEKQIKSLRNQHLEKRGPAVVDTWQIVDNEQEDVRPGLVLRGVG